MNTLYGIPNCDTVKKARTWLDTNAVPYVFHDYKKSGADIAKLTAWCDQFGWEKVLNRGGTTFRKLPDADKQSLHAGKAIQLMRAEPSMIKRPVFEHSKGALIGFDAKAWAAALM